MQVALVSASSILSWSTVGIVGLLQFIKPNIPRIFEAWSALLLLPLNAAINPALYTFIQKKKVKPKGKKNGLKK